MIDDTHELWVQLTPTHYVILCSCGWCRMIARSYTQTPAATIKQAINEHKYAAAKETTRWAYLQSQRL